MELELGQWSCDLVELQKGMHAKDLSQLELLKDLEVCKRDRDECSRMLVESRKAAYSFHQKFETSQSELISVQSELQIATLALKNSSKQQNLASQETAAVKAELEEVRKRAASYLRQEKIELQRSLEAAKISEAEHRQAASKQLAAVKAESEQLRKDAEKKVANAAMEVKESKKALENVKSLAQKDLEQMKMLYYKHGTTTAELLASKEQSESRIKLMQVLYVPCLNFPMAAKLIQSRILIRPVAGGAFRGARRFEKLEFICNLGGAKYLHKDFGEGKGRSANNSCSKHRERSTGSSGIVYKDE
jgi:hypothetical protein